MRKRYLIFLIISVTCSQHLHSQVAFYDAKFLRDRTNRDGKINYSNDSAIAVLYQYWPDSLKLIYRDSSTELIRDRVKAYYNKTNPFIKITGTVEENPVAFTKSGTPKNLLSSVGSLNVTNLADGIAKFLIKRGKEELNAAFFERLRKFLDEHEECKTLFPSTTEFLKNIDAFRYAEFIQSLRESFHKDLSQLLVGLNQLIDLPKYQNYLDRVPEVRVAIRSAKIVSELSQSEAGILPDSIIHSLAALSEWKQINPNLANSWKLLDVISQSIRYIPANGTVSDTTRRWIKLSDMNKMLLDTIQLRILFGLLYEQVEGIAFTASGTTVLVQDFLRIRSMDILKVSHLVENFVTLANDVDRTIQDFRDKQKNGLLSNDDYYSYISKAINITEYGFKVADVITGKPIDDKYIRIARNANDLYKNIYTKNYNNAVTNGYMILEQIIDLLPAGALSGDDQKKFTKLIGQILKYGNFMASVVKAESGEEVQNALEAAALPAGSYSIKQKSDWNISVNGYIGYAWDFLNVVTNPHARGVYAPIGIAVSHGTRRPHGITISGFVSLLDVGSIAAYRIEDSEEDLKQEVRLESIFSPSAQIFFEYRGLPLAVGGGWRRTPKMFYSAPGKFEAAPSRNVFNLSILVDIPLFNIRNWTFDKK